MSWNETKIEKLLKEKLGTLNSSILHYDKYYRQYEQVRGYMCTEIYSHIARTEPNLSDHGPIHIRNVLQNAYKLIEYSLLDKKNTYTPLDLYVLCSTILIHDVGNIHKRDGHEEELTKVYTSNNQFLGIENTEKRLISKIAISHGGKENTISHLSNEALAGERIQSRCIAGLLRFADELAEGPQRTSNYLINNQLISTDSMVYHQYAKILSVPVIQLDTILLQYNIPICEFKEVELEALLILLYDRIFKLNRERINCGIYSEHIQRVKKVAVTISFFENTHDINAIETIDKELIIFELNNLDCNRIEECDIQQIYIKNLMPKLKEFCKQEG